MTAANRLPAPLLILLSLMLLPLLGAGAVAAQESYDLVILNGRVMDPETGRDEIANVGINGDHIAVITTASIQGRKTIDATGHMVAPGFIDILSSIRAQRKAHEDKAGDGVTTAIGLHGGYELSKADLMTAVNAIFWALILGFGMPILGYFMLLITRKVSPMDAAAISAHYGSVSAGTFLTAIAFLDNSQVTYESYPLIMLAVMESPAIIVGLLLAAMARKQLAAKNPATVRIDDEDDKK